MKNGMQRFATFPVFQKLIFGVNLYVGPVYEFSEFGQVFQDLNNKYPYFEKYLAYHEGKYSLLLKANIKIHNF